MADRKARSKPVTLVDVARESGVSPSTVSIVLNEAPLSRHIAATTKERIRRTAQSLGYRPAASARSLRNRRSHTVGVMIFDLSYPSALSSSAGSPHPIPLGAPSCDFNAHFAEVSRSASQTCHGGRPIWITLIRTVPSRRIRSPATGSWSYPRFSGSAAWTFVKEH